MNLAVEIQKAIAEAIESLVFTATVTGTDGEKVYLKRPTQATPDAQSWPRLASYTSPQEDDRVLVINMSAGIGPDRLIVLGLIP